MEQPVRKVTPSAPVVQYDVAALQMKLFMLATVVDDLDKSLGQISERLTVLEERVAWAIK